MKKTTTSLCIFLCFLSGTGLKAQNFMFDDFVYSGTNDAQLGSFNKWSIVNGVSSPISGSTYSKNNITFEADPNSNYDKFITLSTTVNGTARTYTNSRIETADMPYFEGTYAARVFFTDNPNTYKDGNIQTFYSITDYTLHENPAKYSEIDFEYMASDYWGTGNNSTKVMYMTSWNHVIEEPWDPYKAYKSPTGSLAGWHTLVFVANDKTHVTYYIDGVQKANLTVTDQDANLTVYPRNVMQIAFANWIYHEGVNKTGLGTSTANRTSTMKVDWVMYAKNVAKTPAEVDQIVTDYRSFGIYRENLNGQIFPNVTAVEENNSENSLNIYPNPSDNGVYHLSEQVDFITVRNLSGEVILQANKIQEIDLSFAAAGFYTIESNVGCYKIIKR